MKLSRKLLIVAMANGLPWMGACAQSGATNRCRRLTNTPGSRPPGSVSTHLLDPVLKHAADLLQGRIQSAECFPIYSVLSILDSR